MILEKLFIPVLVLVFGCFFGWKYCFERVVDIEFEYFRPNWEADGKPIGGKKSRRYASFTKSDFTASFCFYAWLITTPIWATQHPGAPALLKLMRILFLFWLAAMISLGLIVAKLGKTF